MKVVKNKLFYSIICIVILLVSLSLMLVDFLIPLNLWTHPVLTFFFCLFVGFGLFSFIYGLKNKSAWFVFISSILLGLASFYALIQYLVWWISIVIVFVLWAMFALLSFMRSGTKTEEVLNDNPEYKDYYQRKKENEDGKRESEELPEIKSFK
ncbi:MAG: hypothetical protein IJX16_04475 [Clostridia bacterium]|nr:hypothetical protein [Clostridia bacterium]